MHDLGVRELGAPPTPEQLAEFEELDVNNDGVIPLNDFLQSVLVRADPSLRPILESFSSTDKKDNFSGQWSGEFNCSGGGDGKEGDDGK